MEENGYKLFKHVGVNQVSISPTFYQQLLRVQIPKAQKKTVKLSSFFALLGSSRVKAACRTLVKLTPSFHFFMSSAKF